MAVDFGQCCQQFGNADQVVGDQVKQKIGSDGGDAARCLILRIVRCCLPQPKMCSIGSDPLPPGQAWVISSGGADENPGLYQVNVTEGPGGGVKILNQPAPAPFKESVRYAEQNLYAHARELVGDRDPRSHEFSVQLRAFDSAKSGSGVGVAVLVALCSSLLQKSIKGGLAVTGGLNFGGSIETIFNPVAVVEIAIEKGAASVLMPISSRRQLNKLPDDLAAKITVHYYLDDAMRC